MRRKFLNKQSGLTLVEVLVAIVLVALMMLLFFMIFSQFFSTSKKSEDVISATYVAQTEMEYLYELSKTVPFHELDEKIENDLTEKGYTILSKQNQQIQFKRNEDYNVLIKYDSYSEEGPLVQVSVEVFNSSTDKREIIMENILNWGSDANE